MTGVITELYKASEEDVLKVRMFSTHFNIHYNKSDKYKDVFFKLEYVTGSGYSKELWCVVTNTARALKMGANGLSIPKDNKTYKANLQKISFRRMVQVVDKLVEEGLLNYYKGGVDFSSGELFLSIYEFTSTYKELWKDVDFLEECVHNLSPVQIKDRETKLPLSLKNVKGLSPLLEQMRDYNILLTKHSLKWKGSPLPTQQYSRIFTNSLKTGGRLYNTVGGIQTMPSKERTALTINDEPTVELDFKAMHPSILYDFRWQLEKEMVENWVAHPEVMNGIFDPYTVNLDFVEVNMAKVNAFRKKWKKPSYNPLRNIAKFALMVGLNANGVKEAYSAVVKEFYKDQRTHGDSVEAKYYGIEVYTTPNGLNTFPAKAICETIQAANMPIADHFFSDVGLALQRVDSDIISGVLTSLLVEDEPAFSEHDSIIVRASLADRVEKMMRESYLKVVGSDRYCNVERK